MTHLVVPRSVWPPKCHRVTAWHKDEHITRLLHEEDSLSSIHRLRRQQDRLPASTITDLVQEATTTASVYRATASMDLLYDAHESYGEILDAFTLAATREGPTSHRRISCCLGFLRLGENRREILGKHYDEIRSDWQHFKTLASRAEDFLRGIGAG